MDLAPIPLTLDKNSPGGEIPVTLDKVFAENITIRPVGGLAPTNLQEFLEVLYDIANTPAGG